MKLARIKFFSVITVVLFGFGCVPTQNLQITENATNDRCYSYEDKKCRTADEKKILQQIPNGAFLRELQPIPNLDKDTFIGLYIADPVVDEQRANDDYISCSSTKRGQSIVGVYHLFTYANGKIEGDLVISKSTTFSDYNSDLSSQRIGMAWKNTEANNFRYFEGRPYLKSNQFNLQISNLINFKDLNGDWNPYEFILYGGEYFTCSDDENLIAGYDSESLNPVIYKIQDKDNKTAYWGDNFIPNKNGVVSNEWKCGDHGSDEDIKVTYAYFPSDKTFHFINRTVKKCY